VTPTEIQALLERHGLAAHKGRGQNFLHDAQLADKLAALAGVGPGDAVLEIGTGLGILTRALAARARHVVTVEVDSGLVRALEAEQSLPSGVELRHEDALALDWEALLGSAPGPWRVVANLPYSVATPILRRLLDLAGELAGWGVMVQRELALRIAAPVGSGDYGSFSVLHQLSARIDGALDLHGRCFYPVPRVVSRFLSMVPRGDERPSPDELRAIEEVVRAGFAHRRKTLANALKRAGGRDPSVLAHAFAALGIEARARAETVPPETWRELTRELRDHG
jgi:16S rRNA (adenine1518-N6/adenine1519-N6)-dimethyltransferase